MDLVGYLGVLRRRLIPLLLCVVAGLAGGYYVGNAPDKTYAATSRALVNLPVASGEVQDTLAGTQLSGSFIQTYASIATSRAVAERMKGQLGLPETVEALQGKLAAAQVEGTFLIDIPVTDRDPVRARILADTAAVALGDTVTELEQGKANAVQAQLLDRAAEPSGPVSPRPRLSLALGLALGLAVGVALAALLEALDRTLKTVAQGEQAFGAPLLALVPQRRADARLVVVGDDPTAVAGEPYRALRTSVQFLDTDAPVRTILITSATPGDGKTTTAANFALALAASGQSVCVVDLDLRRASLADAFGLEGVVGFSSVIRRAVALEDALQQWDDGLAVLPAGRPLPPNPSEILGSQATSRLLEDLLQLVDVVVIDSPPALPVTDAVALSNAVDAVILVARHGTTLRSAAAETSRRLAAVGAPVAGFVLNAVPGRDARGYYTDYRYGPPVEKTGRRQRRRQRREGLADGPPAAPVADRRRPRRDDGDTKSPRGRDTPATLGR